jgi:hypothetical protein
MTFILDKYIDSYVVKVIEKMDDLEKKQRQEKIALHLKEILSIDSHMEAGIYDKVITEIIKQIENRSETDFEDIFTGVCRKYTLNGSTITCVLPRILIRIILNKDKFLLKIRDKCNIPAARDQLAAAFASGNKERILKQLQKLKKAGLSGGDVVFSTFDETGKGEDPLLNLKIIDIINKLALDKDVFEGDGKPYTAIKIKYRNSDDFVKKYPTFMDTGWNDKFFPSEKDDKYGRTRNLITHLPDMPEVVHKNIPFAGVMLDDTDILEDRG